MHKTTQERAQEFIRAARSRMGWSQRELSRRTGTFQYQVSEYESGVRKAPADFLFKIADAMGMDIELVEKKDNESTNTN